MKLSKKSLGLISTVVIASFAGVVNAQPHPSDDALVKVCESIKENNTLKLRYLMKQHGLTMRAIENGLKCNGQSPLEFAMTNDANNVASQIAKHMPASDRLIAKR